MTAEDRYRQRRIEAERQLDEQRHAEDRDAVIGVLVVLVVLAVLAAAAIGQSVRGSVVEWRDGWKPVPEAPRPPLVLPNIPPLPRIVVPWRTLNQ